MDKAALVKGFGIKKQIHPGIRMNLLFDTTKEPEDTQAVTGSSYNR
jgi:hypothetical protein